MVDSVFTVKGKLGQLRLVIPPAVALELAADKITVRPRDDSRMARALWGTFQRLVRNLVEGVSQGYTRRLELQGTGFRAAVKGRNIELQLGFSHDVVYPLPEGITAVCARPTSIELRGSDRELLGRVAAEIRRFRPPEPYKGKGVRYADEVIILKEGKKK